MYGLGRAHCQSVCAEMNLREISVDVMLHRRFFHCCGECFAISTGKSIFGGIGG